MSDPVLVDDGGGGDDDKIMLQNCRVHHLARMLPFSFCLLPTVYGVWCPVSLFTVYYVLCALRIIYYIVYNTLKCTLAVRYAM